MSGDDSSNVPKNAPRPDPREPRGNAPPTGLGVTRAYIGKASHGEKTEDLPELAGLLRSGDRRSLSHLFHQGVAKESRDPDVIAATMAKPGVVLRRPVGTDRPLSEHAELPTALGGGGPTKAARKSKSHEEEAFLSPR